MSQGGAPSKATEMSAEQARRAWGDVHSQVTLLGRRFVLTRRGKPLVAIVSVADLESLEKLEAERPRRDLATVGTSES